MSCDPAASPATQLQKARLAVSAEFTEMFPYQQRQTAVSAWAFISAASCEDGAAKMVGAKTMEDAF